MTFDPFSWGLGRPPPSQPGPWGSRLMSVLPHGASRKVNATKVIGGKEPTREGLCCNATSKRCWGSRGNPGTPLSRFAAAGSTRCTAWDLSGLGGSRGSVPLSLSFSCDMGAPGEGTVQTRQLRPIGPGPGPFEPACSGQSPAALHLGLQHDWVESCTQGLCCGHQSPSSGPPEPQNKGLFGNRASAGVIG